MGLVQTPHQPEWTGLELWYIAEKIGGRLKKVAILINPDDKLEVNTLAASPAASRIGRIMYDPYASRRLVEQGNQLVAMDKYNVNYQSQGSEQRRTSTMQPTNLGLFDLAVVQFQMTPKQVQLAHAYWNVAGHTVKLFATAPSVTGVCNAVTSSASYSPSINLTDSTHRCSCRSVKANQCPTPCVHATALLIAVDMGQAVQAKAVQQPKAPKAPKVAKQSASNLQTELARVQAELEKATSAAALDSEDRANQVASLYAKIDALTYDKSVLAEEKEIMAKELVSAQDQVAVLTGNLEEAQRFIADMGTHAALHQHPNEAKLLDELSVVMAHINAKDQLSSIVCNDFERMLN